LCRPRASAAVVDAVGDGLAGEAAAGPGRLVEGVVPEAADAAEVPDATVEESGADAPWAGAVGAGMRGARTGAAPCWRRALGVSTLVNPVAVPSVAFGPVTTATRWPATRGSRAPAVSSSAERGSGAAAVSNSAGRGSQAPTVSNSAERGSQAPAV